MLQRLRFYIQKTWLGDVLNPLWHSRLKRRIRRGQVVAQAAERYLDDVLRGIDYRHTEPVVPASSERVFSIWFQGEEQAPALVRSCWESIRRQTGLELVILDEHTLWDWISLPPQIVDKWRSGKIKAANFSDICRAELLWRHGGYWMDATCFLPHPLPSVVTDSPFFIYMAGTSLRGWYAFIQSCFIHAEAGNPIVGAWCQAMRMYWSKEDSAIDYYINLILFHYAVTHCPEAALEFSRMPKVLQDPTHRIWYGGYADKPYSQSEFERLTHDAAFQKTSYTTYGKRSPLPGSYADYIIHYK